jgi:Flp pilus assembly protein TadG
MIQPGSNLRGAGDRVAGSPDPFGRASVLDDRGSAMIEFSLVLMLMLTVVFGVIELGRLMLTYAILANAARTGARYAVVHGSNRCVSPSTCPNPTDGPSGPSGCSQVTQVIQSSATGLGTLTFNSCSGTNSMYPDGDNAVGSRVTITVSYPYTPMISFLLPSIVTLHSTTQGVICY